VPRYVHAHGCSAEHPNVSRRSAHPSTGVSEAKRQSPDAAMRARERDGLFDMVKNAPAGEVRPRPEERAREKCSSNSNARARVSKDEDGPLHTPSCFETHRSAPRRSEGPALGRAAMLLSMRAGERCAFWPNEPNGDFGQTKPTSPLSTRASRASAGTTSVGSGAPTFGCRK
jgi:hypothetical protein